MNLTQFFLRHPFRCCEVLMYVCMIYELIECYTVYDMEVLEQFFSTQTTFVNYI